MTANEVSAEEVRDYLTSNTPPGACSCGKAPKVVAMSVASGHGTGMFGACAWCYLNTPRALVRAMWVGEPPMWVAEDTERHWADAFVDAFQKHRPGAPFTPPQDLDIACDEEVVALQVANPGVPVKQLAEYAQFKQRTFPPGPSPKNWWAQRIAGWRKNLSDIEAITMTSAAANRFTIDQVREGLQSISMWRSGMRRALHVGFRRVPYGLLGPKELRSRLENRLPFETPDIERVEFREANWLEELLNYHATQMDTWEYIASHLRTARDSQQGYNPVPRGTPMSDKQITVEMLTEAAARFLSVCDEFTAILGRRRLPSAEEIEATQLARNAETGAIDALTIRNVDTLLTTALDYYFRLDDFRSDNPRMTRRPDLVRQEFGEHAEALIERMDSLEAEMRAIPEIRAPGIGLESAERARHYLDAAHPELDGNVVIKLGWLFRFDPPR